MAYRLIGARSVTLLNIGVLSIRYLGTNCNTIWTKIRPFCHMKTFVVSISGISFRPWFLNMWTIIHEYRADSRFASSQWETPLQSNAVSHWLGANLESAYSHPHTSSSSGGRQPAGFVITGGLAFSRRYRSMEWTVIFRHFCQNTDDKIDAIPHTITMVTNLPCSDHKWIKINIDLKLHVFRV